MKKTPEKKPDDKNINGVKRMDTMTPDQMKEMIDWFNSETEQLTKDIRKYNDTFDFYRAAQAEGMRDSYLRCIKKLYELNEQSLSSK